MTKEAIIAEIRKLRPEEDYELTDEQRDELKKRYDEYRDDPDHGSAWEDVRARIEGSLRA